LLDLERSGWSALSTSPEAATRFFSEVLAEHVLLLLPGGLVIDDRGRALESMSGAPWSSFDLTDERVLEVTEDSAVVAYRAAATRAGDEYSALCASLYVRCGRDWRLAFHQQTPT
jgi:hypothetical protein